MHFPQAPFFLKDFELYFSDFTFGCLLQFRSQCRWNFILFYILALLNWSS